MLVTCLEDELLFCCAKTHLDQEETDRIRSLVQKKIDWSYLMQTALHHGVLPLLHRSLYNTCPNSVPISTLNQLRNYFLVNIRRNVLLLEELFKLLHLFESHQISATPYKGPVLAASVYACCFCLR